MVGEVENPSSIEPRFASGEAYRRLELVITNLDLKVDKLGERFNDLDKKVAIIGDRLDNSRANTQTWGPTAANLIGVIIAAAVGAIVTLMAAKMPH